MCVCLLVLVGLLWMGFSCRVGLFGFVVVSFLSLFLFFLKAIGHGEAHPIGILLGRRPKAHSESAPPL